AREGAARQVQDRRPQRPVDRDRHRGAAHRPRGPHPRALGPRHAAQRRGAMSQPTARAMFLPQSGRLKDTQIPVHFNPATLQYTITNTLKDEGRGKKKKQHVSKSSAKLTMDLVFDTTGTGVDVRVNTAQLAGLMEPDKADENSPPIVLFDWGAYSFL